MKIKTKLSLLVIVISIIPLILISLFSFYNYYKTIQKSTEETLYNQLQNQKEALIKFLTPLHELTEYSVNNLEKNGLNWMFQNFSNIISHFSGAENIYVALKDGTFIREPQIGKPENYDPLKTIWYTQALESEETILTSSYIQPLSNKQVLTFAKKFVASSQEGVLGLDVSYENIKNLLSYTSFESQINYIIDNNGNLVVSSSYSSNNEYLIPPMKYGSSAIKQDGKYIYYQQIPEYNWTLVSTIDSKELLSEPLRKASNIAVVALIVIILSIVLSIFFMKSINTPIRDMITKVKLLSDGNLNVDFTTKNKDELSEISNELTKMSVNLKSSLLKFKEVSENIKFSSKELFNISQQISHNNEIILNQTKNIQHDLEESASSIQEVTSGVDEVARAAQGVSRDAQRL
ncbi:MAG TPA: methyl-accepting chemotaxis protein, partial [Candidatus Pacearchaeota archaeon]|nr:methyl-accepting chemotaxis protein [Candidatus Pacearchaeota archaeon]